MGSISVQANSRAKLARRRKPMIRPLRGLMLPQRLRRNTVGGARGIFRSRVTREQSSLGSLASLVRATMCLTKWPADLLLYKANPKCIRYFSLDHLLFTKSLFIKNVICAIYSSKSACVVRWPAVARSWTMRFPSFGPLEIFLIESDVADASRQHPLSETKGDRRHCLFRKTIPAPAAL